MPKTRAEHARALRRCPGELDMEKTMRTSLALAALIAFGSLSTSALADSCSGRNHATGSILGAVGGGLIGNAVTHGNPVGTVGGAVAGGLAGNAIARDVDCDRGRHYDKRSHRYYWYSRHGERVYEERDRRDYDRHYDRDHDRYR
jgi:uncharacterized protein YcfJ